MNYAKKGLESHLVILVVVSLVMGTFVFFILDVVYQGDNPKCEEIKFEITEICKIGSSVQTDIKNSGSSVIRFKVNNLLEENSVTPEEKKSFKFKDIKDNFKINVFFKEGNRDVSCRAISHEFKMEDLRGC